MLNILLSIYNYYQTKHVCYSFVEVAAQYKQHVSAAMSASGKVSERHSFVSMQYGGVRYNYFKNISP